MRKGASAAREFTTTRQVRDQTANRFLAQRRHLIGSAKCSRWVELKRGFVRDANETERKFE